MYRPLLLCTLLLGAQVSFAQLTDTLFLLYHPDEYRLSRKEKQRIDSFLSRNWDRLLIKGFTD